MSAERRPIRVRPHVARAVGRSRHVLLDFDGVMFDVQTALGPDSREKAVAALLSDRPHRPRPITITLGWFGVHETLAYLADHEPDRAVEAETIVSALELDAALTAAPATALPRLLAACTATGRAVAVISDLAEPAVLATLHAHGMNRHVAAVAARQGLELSAIDPAHPALRAAGLLNAPVTDCLLVSGTRRELFAARDIGAIGLGCECGRDRRKHLAAASAPVVSGLLTLVQALLPPS